ncbi:MAG: DGQHR domain-containing protein [Verrucomicrobia bacterium]|nr:DGQHR domain-containing protein [Verrucomicrobiota bacterium]
MKSTARTKAQEVFPAIGSVRGSVSIFQLQMTLADAAKRLSVEPDELPACIRFGRVRDPHREEAWSKYIAGGSAGFPPFFAALLGEAKFTPKARTAGFGALRIPIDAVWVLQRDSSLLRAIRKALAKDPPLCRGETMVPVCLHVGCSTEAIQQMHRRLKTPAVSGTKRILAEEFDLAAKVSRALVGGPSPFAGLTEMKAATLAPRARNLFTLSAIYLATKALLVGPKRSYSDALDFALQYWNAVAEQIPEWGFVREKRLTSGELRSNFLHAHGVVLHGLGRAGAALRAARPKAWRRSLGELKNIDWRRTNVAVWNGRVLVGGKVANTSANVLLVSAFLKSKMRLPLTVQEQLREASLGNSEIGFDASRSNSGDHGKDGSTR